MRRQLLCWLAGVPVGDGNGCNHAGAKFSNCQNATDTVGVTRKRKHETIYEMPSGFDSATRNRL